MCRAEEINPSSFRKKKGMDYSDGWGYCNKEVVLERTAWGTQKKPDEWAGDM